MWLREPSPMGWPLARSENTGVKQPQRSPALSPQVKDYVNAGSGDRLVRCAPAHTWSVWLIMSMRLISRTPVFCSCKRACSHFLACQGVYRANFRWDEFLSDTYGYSEYSGKLSYNVSCDMPGSCASLVYTHWKFTEGPSCKRIM